MIYHEMAVIKKYRMVTVAFILHHPAKTQDVQLIEQYAYAVEGQQMIEPKEAVHSEDYEIEWKDQTLEAIMRLYLDKPEGPIMHSDVW